MTARDLKRYRPGALNPYEHNRIAARRKKYRTLAAQFRTLGRSTHRAAGAFRALAVSANRAAESLRGVARGLHDQRGGPV